MQECNLPKRKTKREVCDKQLDDDFFFSFSLCFQFWYVVTAAAVVFVVSKRFYDYAGGD